MSYSQKIIRGGIGDILLSLDDINPLDSYIVYTHFNKAEELLRPYTKNVTIVPMEQAVGSVQGELVPSKPYPNLKIPEDSLVRMRNKYNIGKSVIGIHPIGSKLSIDFDVRFNRPIKFIPPDYLNKVVRDIKNIYSETEILVFCSTEEADLFSTVKGVTLVSESNIWDAFAVVSMCSIVVGVDSAVKTVSALLRKPTIVLLGDYIDQGRDRFILPYSEIETIKFKIIENTKEELLSKLDNHKKVLGYV